MIWRDASSHTQMIWCSLEAASFHLWWWWLFMMLPTRRWAGVLELEAVSNNWKYCHKSHLLGCVRQVLFNQHCDAFSFVMLFMTPLLTHRWAGVLQLEAVSDNWCCRESCLLGRARQVQFNQHCDALSLAFTCSLCDAHLLFSSSHRRWQNCAFHCDICDGGHPLLTQDELVFFNWKQLLIIDGNAVTSPVLDVWCKCLHCDAFSLAFTYTFCDMPTCCSLPLVMWLFMMPLLTHRWTGVIQLEAASDNWWKCWWVPSTAVTTKWWDFIGMSVRSSYSASPFFSV